MQRFLWVWMFGMGSVACGGGSGLGKPAAQFPSRAELDSVAAQSVSAKSSGSVVDAAGWQMQPMAATAGYPQESTWDQLLLDGVTQRAGAVRASPELRCAAREHARFYVEHAGSPDDGIRRHILVRCGSTLVDTSSGEMTVVVPDDVADAELARHYRGDVADYVKKQLLGSAGGPGSAEAGLGFARGHGRAVWVGYSGRARVRFDGFSPLISGSSVTLQGTLLGPAAHAIALVNQGAYGVKPCESDRSLVLPAFRITCPVLEQDAQARIEIATRTQEQVLLNVVAQLEVRRDENADLSYDAGTYGDNVAAPTADAFAGTLLSGLNRVRAAAGVGQLTLELQQSRTNGKLAPHLFLSSISGDTAEQDTIALGVLAGWDVQGMIRNGGIFFGAVNGSRNPSRWLTSALESPLGRWVLLSPEMSRAAVGASGVDPNGVAALITTYAFFGNQDHGVDEVAVLDELARQRAARGLPPPQRVRSESSLVRALQRVSKNEQDTMDALKMAMQEVAGTGGGPVSGYVMETTDLKLLKFDPSLLTPSSLKVEVGVTHYRAPGGAWGQYAILFVILDPQTQVREARSTPHTASN